MFLTKKIRKLDRHQTYQFFRVVDDIVDEIPAPKNRYAFTTFKNQYYALLQGKSYAQDQYTKKN